MMKLMFTQGEYIVRFGGNHLKPILVALVCASSFLIGCASKPATDDQPQAQSIRLRAPGAPPGTPVTLDQTIKKALFNIHLSPSGIKVNGTPVANVEALEEFLKQQSKPVITIATHRCYNGEKAARVMNLARVHTETPIAYGSFGEFSDPECQ